MTRGEARRSAVAVVGVFLALGSHAFALNNSLDVSQYAHTSWKIVDGFAKGPIRAIAQGAEGYLWLGTEFGLLRFDGVRAVPWEPPSGERLPSADIRSLRTARDASLWIGTYRGLVRWARGSLTHYPSFDGQVIETMLEDRDGTMWVVAGWTLSEARLCDIQSGNTHCYGESGGFGAGVTTVYEDSAGRVWTGGMRGVARWKPGPPTFYPVDGPAQRTYALTESGDGGLLIARRGGLLKMRNGSFERAELTSDSSVLNAPVIHVDVDGGAVKHADARHFTVTIHYEPRQLRLIIRDDGKGIDAETLARQEMEGHFGLPGMRERAGIVRGRLVVHSVICAGTEIELRVPASIAHAASRRWWIERARADAHE